MEDDYACVLCPVGIVLRCSYLPETDDGEGKARKISMTWKSKLVLGILTALAMFALTFALPRGSALQNAQLAQFPLTVGVWAIFVLLFVKLK